MALNIGFRSFQCFIGTIFTEFLQQKGPVMCFFFILYIIFCTLNYPIGKIYPSSLLSFIFILKNRNEMVYRCNVRFLAVVSSFSSYKAL